jgi:hypothetical protein
MPIHSGWGFDSRCGYCYLGHAHTWQQHDDSILNTAVQDVESTFTLHLDTIPESRQAEYLTAVYRHLTRRLKETSRTRELYYPRPAYGRFQNYEQTETIKQGWEHLQALIEVKYPSAAI